MRIGILATTDGPAAPLAGIVREASARGHGVVVFATDAGAGLLRDPAVASLAGLPGVEFHSCRLSVERLGVRAEDLPAGVREGSQLDNAAMVAETDRLIVL